MDVARSESKSEVAAYLETGRLFSAKTVAIHAPQQAPESTSLPIINSIAVAASSQYTCPACLAKFLTDTQVFCGECGTKKREL